MWWLQDRYTQHVSCAFFADFKAYGNGVRCSHTAHPDIAISRCENGPSKKKMGGDSIMGLYAGFADR